MTFSTELRSRIIFTARARTRAGTASKCAHFLILLYISQRMKSEPEPHNFSFSEPEPLQNDAAPRQGSHNKKTKTKQLRKI
jgi:hypothetical protein